MASMLEFYSEATLILFNPKLRISSFFYSFFGGHIHMSYFGATGTPVFDFFVYNAIRTFRHQQNNTPFWAAFPTTPHDTAGHFLPV